MFEEECPKFTSAEKTKAVVDTVFERERIKYQEMYMVGNWIFNPRTCLYINPLTGVSGKGLFEFIKRTRGL